MWSATQNLGPIILAAVLTLIGYRQADTRTEKPNNLFMFFVFVLFVSLQDRFVWKINLLNYL